MPIAEGRLSKLESAPYMKGYCTITNRLASSGSSEKLKISVFCGKNFPILSSQFILLTDLTSVEMLANYAGDASGPDLRGPANRRQGHAAVLFRGFTGRRPDRTLCLAVLPSAV